MSNIFGEEDISMFPENNFLPKVVSRAKRFVTRGQWSAAEDRSLVRLVTIYGVRNWSCIAERLGGRIGKQCRERWHNHLCPDIKKQAWCLEEDKAFIEAHKKYVNRWAEIARHIPGRSENAIKNRWNTYLRKYLLMRNNQKTGGVSNQINSELLEHVSLCARPHAWACFLKLSRRSKKTDSYNCKEIKETQEVYNHTSPLQ